MQEAAIPELTRVETSENVRIITFGADPVRDVENVLARELEGLTDDLGPVQLLLDFNHVNFITSIELGTLVCLHKKMQASGGRLILFHVDAQVRQVLEVTRLDTLIAVCQ